jgi:hypothetical protein
MAKPTPHMKVDNLGMLKGYMDEDDNDEDEVQEEKHANVNVNYSTYSKNKKLKTSHDPTSYWRNTTQPYPYEVPSSIKVRKTTDSQVTTSIPGLSTMLDMSMTEIEAETHRNLVKSCVRKNMFSIWKFYNKASDSHYSQDEKTWCGYLLKYTKIQGDECWWVEIRKLVVKTHTDMRNNAIKNMQTKFKGKHQLLKQQHQPCMIVSMNAANQVY